MKTNFILTSCCCAALFIHWLVGAILNLIANCLIVALIFLAWCPLILLAQYLQGVFPAEGWLSITFITMGAIDVVGITLIILGLIIGYFIKRFCRLWDMAERLVEATPAEKIPEALQW
jgi:hypothetical protein